MNLKSILMRKPDVQNIDKFIEEQSQLLTQYFIRKEESAVEILKILDSTSKLIGNYSQDR
ncbi:hypothetical protein PRCB_03875 [Pantoea rodasii]|uniref:Uncharacterized protein n=1 Tax=Pantoea rodasii TaxID=1076549 RepID=A0A2M9WEA0_9GAMM|nr:hypothetical protein HA45_26855 [Pantoea rodasii]PJZ05874.1 hypothetical protein PRCB_03875 [Pantoea rodasii]